MLHPEHKIVASSNWDPYIEYLCPISADSSRTDRESFNTACCVSPSRSERWPCQEQRDGCSDGPMSRPSAFKPPRVGILPGLLSDRLRPQPWITSERTTCGRAPPRWRERSEGRWKPEGARTAGSWWSYHWVRLVARGPRARLQTRWNVTRPALGNTTAGNSGSGFFEDNWRLASRLDSNDDIEQPKQAGLFRRLKAEVVPGRALRSPCTKTLVEKNGYGPVVAEAKY